MFGDDEVSCDPVEVGVSEGDIATKESETDTDLGYRITSIPEISENERLISCSYGNPMRSNSGVKFRLMLAVPDLMHTTSLPFLIYTTTLSTELNPDDNRKNFTILAKNKVTTEFKGYVDQSHGIIFYCTTDQVSYHFTHLREFYLTYTIPTHGKDKKTTNSCISQNM